MANIPKIDSNMLTAQDSTDEFSVALDGNKIVALSWNRNTTSLDWKQGFDLSELDSLEYLDISGMGLDSIPVLPPSIKTLYLGGDNYFRSGWENLAACADTLTTLSFPGADMSAYRSIPASIGPLPNLHSLACKNAVMPGSQVPSAFGGWTGLRLVDFSGCSLPRGADNVISRWSNLIELAMVGCGLSEFPLFSPQVTDIRRLSLQDNNIDYLPISVFENIADTIDLTGCDLHSDDYVFQHQGADGLTWGELTDDPSLSNGFMCGLKIQTRKPQTSQRDSNYVNLSDNQIKHLPDELCNTAPKGNRTVTIVADTL